MQELQTSHHVRAAGDLRPRQARAAGRAALLHLESLEDAALVEEVPARLDGKTTVEKKSRKHTTRRRLEGTCNLPTIAELGRICEC